ncbi:hypothetical protein TRVL_08837 [Trypanosoma vivax]|nr:hypothetical protein TRVL_08837 [Trypanosoma vivax]
MVTYLDHSVSVLSDAETKIKSASGEVVEDAREFFCNVLNRTDSIYGVFSEYKGDNLDKLARTNISSTVSKLNKSKSLTEVMKTADSALNVILETGTAADSVDLWIEKARSTYDNMSFA